MIPRPATNVYHSDANALSLSGLGTNVPTTLTTTETNAAHPSVYQATILEAAKVRLGELQRQVSGHSSIQSQQSTGILTPPPSSQTANVQSQVLAVVNLLKQYIQMSQLPSPDNDLTLTSSTHLGEAKSLASRIGPAEYYRQYLQQQMQQAQMAQALLGVSSPAPQVDPVDALEDITKQLGSLVVDQANAKPVSKSKSLSDALDALTARLNQVAIKQDNV